MTRWVGVDYGTRRIGIALSDPGGSIASPADTLDASGRPADDAKRILAWAAKHEGGAIVVGLPLNMDGSVGPQAVLSQQLTKHLRAAGPLPVHTWDERLSSFQADEWLAAGGARRGRRRRLRDALAAQAILQSFLDARRADAGEPG